MKKIVLLTALLCLLIAFQSVFAYTEPKAYTNLVYNGTDQYLVSQGVGDSGNESFYFWNDLGENEFWDTDRPVGHLPDDYTVRYVLTTPDRVNSIKKDHCHDQGK